MLRQFKGIKWINNIPYFILYDYKKNILEYKEVSGCIKISKTNIKKCNGYYDLVNRKYMPCPIFFDEKSSNAKQ